MPAICHILFNIVLAIAISSPYHFENKPRAGTVAAVSIPGLLAINLTSPWSINSGQIWISGEMGVSLNLATFIYRVGGNLCLHKSKYPSIYSNPEAQSRPSSRIRFIRASLRVWAAYLSAMEIEFPLTDESWIVNGVTCAEGTLTDNCAITG